MHESKLNHGVSSISEKFIVNGESSEILQLREGPFNNPSLGEYLKFGRTFIRPEHNLHNPPEIIAAPVAKRPPRQLPSARIFLRRGNFAAQFLNHQRSTFTVMETGFMHSDCHRQSKCINYNVLLSAFDFLVTVDTFAAGVSMVGGPDTTGIYDTHIWAFLAIGKFTHISMKSVHYIFKHSFKFPFAEIIVNRIPWRKILRQHTPLASGFVDVHYTVHDFP